MSFFENWHGQAWIVIIIYLILDIILAVLLIKSGNVSAGVITFIIFTLISLLLAFDVNCTIDGQCNIWSWIKTGLIAISPLLLIIVLIKGTIDKNKLLPLFNKNNSIPLSNKNNSIPLSNKNNSMPLFNQNNSVPLFNQNNSMPFFNQNDSMPFFNQNDSMPFSREFNAP